MHCTTRHALAASVVALGALAAPSARADDPSAEARVAYDAGTAAHARRDYREASLDFARADQLAPNPVALKAAIDEAVLADDAELGMHLVDRARARGADAAMQPSIQSALARFAGRTGRVRVDCGTARSCRVAIDGRAIDPASAAIVLTGAHRVAIDADGRAIAEAVVVQGDREVDLVVPAAPPATSPSPRAPAMIPVIFPSRSGNPPPPAASSGLSPAWFLGAAGATVVAGGLSIASAIDTANQHSTFVDRCSRGGDPSCAALASDGSSAQTRTNVALAATAVLGAATITLAVFTRWRSTERDGAALVVSPRGAGLRLLF